MSSLETLPPPESNGVEPSLKTSMINFSLPRSETGLNHDQDWDIIPSMPSVEILAPPDSKPDPPVRLAPLSCFGPLHDQILDRLPERIQPSSISESFLRSSPPIWRAVEEEGSYYDYPAVEAERTASSLFIYNPQS